jgi:hypothetical protein
MITITYSIDILSLKTRTCTSPKDKKHYNDFSYVFRTFDVDDDITLNKFMWLRDDKDSVKLDSVSNPLTQYKNTSKLEKSGS